MILPLFQTRELRLGEVKDCAGVAWLGRPPMQDY